MNFRDATQRFEHGGGVFAVDRYHGDGANPLRFRFRIVALARQDAAWSERLGPLKTRSDEPPYYQDYDRANDCADETSVFARLIPPDCLAKVCCYKSSNNPEHGRHDVPSGLKLISRINQFRDHPGHKPNYDASGLLKR